ncbi:MAG TPA: inorganic phosphate transporter [Bacteroidales bacterium]|nr:inorganic phosphate transporter [Bacteroidales bacterium]
MHNIYLLFVIVLFILAISDLIVGVTNDAANFLNSAIGSKVASFKVILAIAGLGVVLGATFSSGMMEIARKGIFHPDQFFFSEIMIIFLAVMITDVMLLDTFNTFGLPTSTTVSIVFELLGAAVAISLVKIHNSPDTMADLSRYINSAKALAIISGILLSVVIAFASGTIVQFITRLIFSFNYQRYLKYFGAIWGGIVITAIVYFILVKGAKGASFMTTDTVEWIHTHTTQVLLFSFIGFAIILQFLITVFNLNILKIIVLVGTFSLAMAFAGNDLVNFIGVPLAGFESFKEVISNPSFNPNTYYMTALLEPVKTPTLFLVGAGLIMVVTLFFSKKARTVSSTEVNLARQGSGIERFSSSLVSRSLVRGIMGALKISNKFVPVTITNFIDKRFDSKSFKKKFKNKKDVSSFDLLRASVNMFVASILIAIATSLKLPLSTTYVTFMVAMGTSLADRAWGRESAVYRITGVITVISGWFFTAFVAFTVSFLIALFLNWGGIIATLVALGIAALFIIRTHFIHKERSEKQNRKDEFDDKDTLNGENILQKCNSSITSVVGTVSKLYFSTILNLIKEDRKKMKKVIKNINELNQQSKDLKYNIYPTLRKLEEDSIETGPYYVQILDYIREITHCLKYISDPVYEHLDNNHPPLLSEQIKDLHELNAAISAFYDEVLKISNKRNFRNLESLIAQQQSILDLITKIKKKQIKFIKSEQSGTRNILMYLNVLAESKNLVLYTLNMVKSHRDFLLDDNHTNK